jgi:transcriptional regulator with XRE-family HTH domain
MSGLAKALRAGREAAGLTQRQVSHRLGITERAVARWEAGHSKPRAKQLPAVAALYGLDLNRLLAMWEEAAVEEEAAARVRHVAAAPSAGEERRRGRGPVRLPSRS